MAAIIAAVLLYTAGLIIGNYYFFLRITVHFNFSNYTLCKGFPLKNYRGINPICPIRGHFSAFSSDFR